MHKKEIIFEIWNYRLTRIDYPHKSLYDLEHENWWRSVDTTWDSIDIQERYFKHNLAYCKKTMQEWDEELKSVLLPLKNDYEEILNKIKEYKNS